MKFDYLVKHNGVYYKAGEDVPTDNVGASTPKAEKPTVPVEKKVEEVKPVVETEKVVEKVETKYTKTDINRMSTDDLRKLASSLGMDGNSYVGSELKKILIDKLV